MPLYEKGREDLKENFRPVNIFPVSQFLLKYLFSSFWGVFSKYQCEFRKHYSTQHCLLKVLEKWKKCVGKGKQNSWPSITCTQNECLSIKQIVKNENLKQSQHLCGNSISSSIVSNIWTAIIQDLFDDLFFILSDTGIASYADKNTPYNIAYNIYDLIKLLEKASTALSSWFDNNLLKSNLCKCYLLKNSIENITVKISK